MLGHLCAGAATVWMKKDQCKDVQQEQRDEDYFVYLAMIIARDYNGHS